MNLNPTRQHRFSPQNGEAYLGGNGTSGAGTDKDPVIAPAHFKFVPQPGFTRSERDRVTVLCGGLTPAHERLLKALLESRDFRVHILPTPTVADYQIGRRYANNGFCNPLYFTGGSLITFLRAQEEQGLSRAEVNKRFVYITSQAKGPCRLGLYEQEYRNILRNAGYADFRVFAFSETLSLSAKDSSQGVPFDIRFYANLISAIMLGDVLNDIASRTRPYEREKGATDRAWEESIRFAEQRFRIRTRLSLWFENHLPAWLNRSMQMLRQGIMWYMDVRLFRVILHARNQFRAVRIDPFRIRPRVKFIGEFWAQTTQGDGNFNAHRYLERHDAEVVTEPITTWMLYLLFEAEQILQHQIAQLRFARKKGLSGIFRDMKSLVFAKGRIALLRVAGFLSRLKYNAIRLLFHSIPDRLPSIPALARIANEYYMPALTGGESFLEVGKTLYYTQTKRAHLVISLKPFGCMPSSMSDGVQPLVRARHPDTLFLSVETSSESSTNAQSRMLMVLNAARERADREYSVAKQNALKGAYNVLKRIQRRRHRANALSRCTSSGSLYACRAASELLSLSSNT